MPPINVQFTKGATRGRKSRVVRRMTDVLVEELGRQPEHIHIVIQKEDNENREYARMLTDESKRQPQSQRQQR